MSAWNPASSVNTLEQTYRLGQVDARKAYVTWLGSLKFGDDDAATERVVRAVRLAIERDELGASLPFEDA